MVFIGKPEFYLEALAEATEIWKSEGCRVFSETLAIPKGEKEDED